MIIINLKPARFLQSPKTESLFPQCKCHCPDGEERYFPAAVQLSDVHRRVTAVVFWIAGEGTILLSTQDLVLGCGFSTVECRKSTSKCLVLSVGYLGKDGGFMPDRVVWTANRDLPLPPNSTLEFTAKGNLVLNNLQGKPVWSSNTSGKNVSKLKLKKSGNLVLVGPNNSEIWRSFDYPSDTMMAGQSLAVEDRSVTLYVTDTQDSSVSPYATWRLNQHKTSNITGMALSKYGDLRMMSGNKSIESTKLKYVQQGLKFLFMRLEHNGALKLYFEGLPAPLTMNHGTGGSKFKVAWKGKCALPYKCGRYGICSKRQGNCSCPPSKHFQGKSCAPLQPLICGNSSRHSFVELNNTDYFATHFDRGIHVTSSAECKQLCLQNCSCKLAIFKANSTSSMTGLCYNFKNVMTLINVTEGRLLAVAFLKVEDAPGDSNSSRTRSTMWVVAMSLLILTAMLLPVAVLYWNKLRTKKKRCGDEILESIPGVPRRFSFVELRDATINFSRKLGSGGFGTVYHGMLEDGTKVAVKQLENTRGGGDKQFRAEVVAIGSVHHGNLVKLIGFCCDEQKHTLLVYEYMPNGSLDKWIFGTEFLDWKTRSKIALDIAKGLAYLHEGCEQAVLHLDIKPQNILLDVEFKAKISDFGLAIFATKSFNMDTIFMRGTPGYIAPEWLQSQVSVKLDVYSFGIVLLEILSGKQALEFLDAMSSHLQAYHNLALRDVDKECLVQLLDSRLRELSGYVSSEVERFILVSLCCIQDDPSNRPAMGSVVKMLEGNLEIPDVLLNLKYQSTALPKGIASFLAANSR